jgi:hypothetical protein
MVIRTQLGLLKFTTVLDDPTNDQQLKTIQYEEGALIHKADEKEGKKLKRKQKRLSISDPETADRSLIDGEANAKIISKPNEVDCDLIINKQLPRYNSQLIADVIGMDPSSKIKDFLMLIKLFAKAYNVSIPLRL